MSAGCSHAVKIPCLNMANATLKIIVITGCSSGLGLHTSVMLAKEKGFKVIATMRNMKKKDSLEKAAGDLLNKSLFIQELDVSKEDSILKFMKATIENEGRIDILINNAAAGQMGIFENVPMEQMQSLFQTNFFGTCRLTQEVVRIMKEQNSGHIIFISSIGGICPFLFSDFYIASKCAMEGIAGCLAPVLSNFNIKTTIVQPGPMNTAFGANVSANKQGEFAPEENTDGTADKSTEMKKKFMNFIMAEMMPDMQTGDEAAEVIKKCIYDEKPHLRYQTSTAMEERAKQILVDPTGDQMNDHLAAIFK